VICGRSFFLPGTPVSSTNKTDCHNITEILLKVALNIIILILFLHRQYEHPLAKQMRVKTSHTSFSSGNRSLFIYFRVSLSLLKMLDQLLCNGCFDVLVNDHAYTSDSLNFSDLLHLHQTQKIESYAKDVNKYTSFICPSNLHTDQ
jgi:hypothetical protein